MRSSAACYSAAMRCPLLSLFILTAGLTGCAPSGGGRAAGADMSLDPPTTDAMPPIDMASGSLADAIPPDVITPDAISPDAIPPLDGTAGCGLAPRDARGGVQIEEAFDAAAGGPRSYFLALPADYDPARRHRLIVAYAGTDWSGAMIRPYLDLERDGRADEIVVYPDLLVREFDGWGRLGGWVLGPHATPADGMEDIEFTRQLLDRLGERYCLDPARVFATGHSWGGDMAAVVGCFLGDRFAAVAPAAANRPYWFEPREGPVGCVGHSAVWTFFGEADEHFAGQQAAPGQFGDEQDAFWRAHNACDDTRPLATAIAGGCVQHDGCLADTRYCLYGPETGHQIPRGFAAAVLDWFRGF